LQKAIGVIFPELPADDYKRIFESIDVNGDGQVSYSEFLAATIDPENIDIEQLNKAFRVLDEDNNGFITTDELRKVGGWKLCCVCFVWLVLWFLKYGLNAMILHASSVLFCVSGTVRLAQYSAGIVCIV
jgi:hypothetical protein